MRSRINVFSRELFQASLAIYLLLLLLETVKTGLVSWFFNTNYLLGLVLAAGVVSIVTQESEKKIVPAQTEIRTWDWYVIIGATLGAGGLIYYKLQDLGNIAIVAGIAGAVLVLLVSILIYSPETNEE